MLKGKIKYISLIVAVAGILVPIIWTSYIGRYDLVLRILYSAQLIPDDPIFEEMQVTLDAKTIKKLAKTSYVFLNRGNMPIHESDVALYPVLKYLKKDSVLSALVERKQPLHSNSRVELNGNENSVEMRFLLLNPGDFIRFSVYFDQDSVGEATLQHHIKNIPTISVEDLRKTDLADSKPSAVVLTIVGMSVLFLTLLLFPSYPEMRKHRRARRFLRLHEMAMHQMSPEQLYSFASSQLEFLVDDEIKFIQDRIRALAAEKATKDEVIELVKYFIRDTGGSEVVFWPSVVGIISGIIYVVVQYF